MCNPQKDEIHTVTKPSEKCDPPTAKKAKLTASTSSTKKSSAVSVKKNPATKKQRTCKVLVPAEMVSVKFDPTEYPLYPIMSNPPIKEEVKAEMTFSEN